MMPGRQRRRCPGLIVRRGHLDPAETTWRRGCRLTTPVRTAFDLARWAPTLVEKVVAVDALAYRHRFAAESVRELARRHFGVHGSTELPRVPALANPLAESPMETRIRLALVLAGFDARTVLRDPDRVVAVVRAELRCRGVSADRRSSALTAVRPTVRALNR